jgi:hypothetical protein
MKHLFIAISLVIIFIPSCKEKKMLPEIQEIADAHGIKNFEKVTLIDFTFNVQRDTFPASKRQWKWNRQTNEITFVTDSGSTRFARYDTSTTELRKLNARFTNDEYWLLFPFHLVWDDVVALTDEGMVNAPISAMPMRKIKIQYNDSAGFTPGDMYTIFTDSMNIVREWEHYGQHATEPGLISTWENYQDHRGMKLATDHRSKDGKLRVWITNIEIR